MVAGAVIYRSSRAVVTRCQGSLFIHVRRDNRNFISTLQSYYYSLPGSQDKGVTRQMEVRNPVIISYTVQRCGISSSASLHFNENAASQNGAETTDLKDTKESTDSNDAEESTNSGSSGKTDASDEKREEESGSDEEELSAEDLVKLVAEKEGSLKTKQKEIEITKDKLLRTYADMENVMERTKREAENSKKFAIQNFAKSLLDVADNLGRASSVVKESFEKIDTSKDNAGAVPLLKTLLEGVEMTEKQLAEVFKKFGVEKYDPTNEQFDPNRHNAVFQVPDPTKPPDSVAVVLKAGYMLHDRVLRPAEVGVTIPVEEKDENKGSQT